MRPYSAYLFDLDGTIYLGDELLPGVTRLLTELRNRKVLIRFLSNNPTRTPQMYVTKLAGLGIQVSPNEVVNTVTTTVSWLQLNHPNAVLFAIAEPPLISALAAAGFRFSSDPAEIEVVIASYDRSFNYRKLQIAFDALWFHRRAILIQTNPDRYCPFPGGRGEPDCAAIVAAIEACTGVKCLANMGKPDSAIVEAALPGLTIPRSDVLMVGDRLGTDIELAHRSGTASALVLTGDSTRSELANYPNAPTYVLERIDELLG